jgi:hypothetical protein
MGRCPWRAHADVTRVRPRASPLGSETLTSTSRPNSSCTAHPCHFRKSQRNSRSNTAGVIHIKKMGRCASIFGNPIATIGAMRCVLRERRILGVARGGTLAGRPSPTAPTCDDGMDWGGRRCPPYGESAPLLQPALRRSGVVSRGSASAENRQTKPNPSDLDLQSAPSPPWPGERASAEFRQTKPNSPGVVVQSALGSLRRDERLSRPKARERSQSPNDLSLFGL